MPNITLPSDFSIYVEDGLSWKSNLSYIHPRNEVGSIILQESSSTNPILIIEPVKFNYSVGSVTKVIDTRFKFYEFPVSTTVSTTNLSLDTSIDIVSNTISSGIDELNKSRLAIDASKTLAELDENNINEYNRLNSQL
jgi:hypothetical protein